MFVLIVIIFAVLRGSGLGRWSTVLSIVLGPIEFDIRIDRAVCGTMETQ
jgi:hypothetical protein